MGVRRLNELSYETVAAHRHAEDRPIETIPPNYLDTVGSNHVPAAHRHPAMVREGVDNKWDGLDGPQGKATKAWRNQWGRVHAEAERVGGPLKHGTTGELANGGEVRLIEAVAAPLERRILRRCATCNDTTEHGDASNLRH